MAQQLRLPDGRHLDYSVDGAEAGFPLIWLHGTPGSYKATLPALIELGREKGIKIISSSRAGYGGSSRHPGRSVLDTVADMEALKKHLGVQQCVVGGWSGGGPGALACAARLSGCLAALCVAGVGPFGEPDLDFLAGQGQDNIEEFEAVMQGEVALRSYLEDQRSGLLAADATGLIEEWSTILPQEDKEALRENPTLGQNVIEGLHEGLKNGVDGWLDDDLDCLRPWSYDLSEIKVPVFLYQGKEDKMVPFAHGKWLAKHLPEKFLHSYLMDGHGHISIFLGQIDTMLEDLMEVVRRSS